MTYKEILKIIQENEIMMPKDFARLLWPESEGWKRVINVGHGATAGGGMPRAAGGLLGRLRADGLIGLHYPVQLTDKGREYLKNRVESE